MCVHAILVEAKVTPGMIYLKPRDDVDGQQLHEYGSGLLFAGGEQIFPRSAADARLERQSLANNSSEDYTP